MGPISHHLGASLSLILSSSHQAHNIITKPPVALPHNLSHISPIFSICAIPPSTASTTPSSLLQSLHLPSTHIALHTLKLLFFTSSKNTPFLLTPQSIRDTSPGSQNCSHDRCQPLTLRTAFSRLFTYSFPAQANCVA